MKGFIGRLVKRVESGKERTIDRLKPVEDGVGPEAAVARELFGKGYASDLTSEQSKMLSGSPNPLVRVGVASNPKTPCDVLETLSHDSNREVRLSVALNPNATLATIDAIMHKADSDVATEAERHFMASGIPSPARPFAIILEKDGGFRVVRKTESEEIVFLS